jgi:hypothetical protein
VIFWAQRMLHATGDAAYADWLERVLYNGFLAGVSLAGTKYFYENPLADSGQGEDDPWYGWARRPPRQRQEWHACTCCPPNAQRLLAALPGYFYSASADGLWVHLFGQSQLQGQLADGAAVTITQATDYPWEGQVRLTVTSEAEREFTLRVRIPGWAETAAVAVDGRAVDEAAPGQYLALRRVCRPGSVVEIDLGMPARRLVSDERVAGNRGSVAVQRGPLVYCLEGADHAGADVRDLRLPDEAALTPQPEAGLLNDVTVVEAAGLQAVRDDAAPLYRRSEQPTPEAWTPAPLRFIPYYAWGNRGPNSMTVWVRR